MRRNGNDITVVYFACDCIVTRGVSDPLPHPARFTGLYLVRCDSVVRCTT